MGLILIYLAFILAPSTALGAVLVFLHYLFPAKLRRHLVLAVTMIYLAFSVWKRFSLSNVLYATPIILYCLILNIRYALSFKREGARDNLNYSRYYLHLVFSGLLVLSPFLPTFANIGPQHPGSASGSGLWERLSFDLPDMGNTFWKVMMWWWYDASWLRASQLVIIFLYPYLLWVVVKHSRFRKLVVLLLFVLVPFFTYSLGLLSFIPPLSGRVVDTNGKPIFKATIERNYAYRFLQISLGGMWGFRSNYVRLKTDRDGNFSFPGRMYLGRKYSPPEACYLQAQHPLYVGPSGGQWLEPPLTPFQIRHTLTVNFVGRPAFLFTEEFDKLLATGHLRHRPPPPPPVYVVEKNGYRHRKANGHWGPHGYWIPDPKLPTPPDDWQELDRYARQLSLYWADPEYSDEIHEVCRKFLRFPASVLEDPNGEYVIRDLKRMCGDELGMLYHWCDFDVYIYTKGFYNYFVKVQNHPEFSGDTGRTLEEVSKKVQNKLQCIPTPVPMPEVSD
jgi:hypothetical protein